jgi:hypothetical protein
LLTAINYRPKADRVQWIVPKKTDPEDPKHDPHIEYKSDPSASKLALRLSWTVKETTFSDYSPPTPCFKLVLHAANKTDHRLGFTAIRLIIYRMKDMGDKRLYNTKWSEWKKKPGTKDTWDIQAENIEDRTELCVVPELTDDEFLFNIRPVVKSRTTEGKELPDRFIMPSDPASSFDVELNGTSFLKSDKTGTYIVRIKEIWQKLAKSGTSSKTSSGSGNDYLMITFAADKTVTTKWLTQEESDKTRGVESKSTDTKK